MSYQSGFFVASAKYFSNVLKFFRRKDGVISTHYAFYTVEWVSFQ